MVAWLALWVGASLAQDTPRGTDLVARVEVGAMAAELRSAWEELDPLFAAWPALGSVARDTLDAWIEVAVELERVTGADLDRAASVATLVADADATGGDVWAVVVRGARPKRPAAHDFLIDGHPAHRLEGREIAWSVVGDALVFGNERGVQRQVRQVRKPSAGDRPIQVRARRLRDRAPLVLAFEAPAAVSAELSEELANVGPLVGAVRGGSLVAKPGRIWMQLSAESDDDQQAIEHGVRAFVALARAGTSLLEGGAEAIRGLDLLGARPPSLPDSLDASALETLAEDWLRGFEVRAKIRERKPEVIEAELEVSSHRGLAAALGVMAVMLVPTRAGPRAEAEVLLELLRRAERAHHARTGEYISCGPVPETLPSAPTAWPAGSCFDALGFAPPTKVRFQLVAGVEDGELVLMARGDTDGDGRAEIWVLEGDDVAMQPLPSPPSPP